MFIPYLLSLFLLLLWLLLGGLIYERLAHPNFKHITGEQIFFTTLVLLLLSTLNLLLIKHYRSHPKDRRE
ncbi:hypothetical protein LJY25_13485 [Hymenobacter sp. BT175]|uniref:hypothetical protein n=1 Tax=Hymenobacter translucens TaxID=2886507 RepID=UPI001D0EA86E|nr:hypothetical protein [Hymenobacter translucens]MCC2547462.1 hypothetical protein [Hymenobacter translucens]